VQIELETSEQAAGIRTLLVEAFPTPDEADLVERLRDGGYAEIGLTATEEERVIGYLLLSRMSAPMKALGLAPLAVAADKRRLGIGQSLIEAGLERA
jgi:putative acetyltransferase